MLPVGCSQIDYEAQKVFVLGVDRKQVESLPAYNEQVEIDQEYEENLREAYLNVTSAIDSAVLLSESQVPRIKQADARQANYNYTQAADLYELSDRHHRVIKEYQDRLIAEHQTRQEKEVIDQLVTKNKSVEQLVVSSSTSSTQATHKNKPTRCACLIFNPVAGQSNSEQDLATITSLLEPEFDLDIRMTTPDKDADEIAKEAVEQGAQIIIASGGDGTLSAAAEAVVGTGIPLGVISRGTANAFATALGIPATIPAACQTILDGKTRTVDAAYCNGRPMVLLAGIGFEAETVKRADRDVKNRFGMLAYVLAGIHELRNLESFETRIETEDKVITLNAAAVTVANAAPPTSVLAQGPAELLVDDGLLDVTIVAPTNTISAIAAAYNLLQSAYSGEVADRPDTGFLRARSIKISTNPPQRVVVDGELMGSTPIEVECVPGGLTIIVPTVPEELAEEKLDGLPNLQIKFKKPPVAN
ncbi:YegS/Rv2252/BmrU family lipid kinase [Gloeocapsopsis crepidinum LEGE 06123]|uniref:YegS/Rv2252/BmrU family lipid kinase n=2 Tax=Gloeocapsopsis crepidinum TaxID=693223 RepID=A0ABR9UMQ1_9CHRO|nr:YegS/Rv2252/BmrU family lipid kinase [Gloeocapsopsis crepidinum LEGE 06123]